MLARISTASLAVLLATSSAHAEPETGGFWVTPRVGVALQGDYYDDPVFFADGDVEFLRLDPDAGVVIGAQLGYQFHDVFAGYFDLSFISADADYIENDDVRGPVDFDTLAIDLGVLANVATLGEAPAELGVGGGLTLAHHELSPFIWDEEVVEVDTTSLGIHGLAALDFGLTDTVALRGQAKLSLIPIALDELEDEIGFAEGEAADLEGNVFVAFELAIGVTFRF